VIDPVPDAGPSVGGEEHPAGPYREARTDSGSRPGWPLGWPNGRSTALKVSERNLPSEEAKAISDQGWGMALTALKSLLEAGWAVPSRSSTSRHRSGDVGAPFGGPLWRLLEGRTT
jgi:hypothetical protein